MATRVLHPQWRDYNDPIHYPFADTATLLNAEGTGIPETAFIDAVFYPDGLTTGLYLASVDVSGDTITLTLADDGSTARCSGSFDLLDLPSDVRFVDSYGRAAGMIVSEPERLAVFQAWPTGTHTFTAAQTAFAATCCIPTPSAGVTGVVLADDTALADDVWLIGSDGVVLSARDVTEYTGAGGAAETVTVIRVDLVGDPLFRRRLCGNAFSEPSFLRQLIVKDGVRTISCEPDQYGNIRIFAGSSGTADTVLRLKASSDGLTFEVLGKTV